VTSFIGFQERLNSSWRSYTFANPGTADPEVLRQRVRAGGGQAPLALVLVKDRMNTPRNVQWSAGVGHQLTRELGINLDYVQQQMSDLYVRLDPNYFNTHDARPRARARLRRRHPLGRLRPRELPGRDRPGHVPPQPVAGEPRLHPGLLPRGLRRQPGERLPFRSSYAMQPTSGDERHRVVLSGLTPTPLRLHPASIIATVASPRPACRGRDDERDT
jgi:hypothetical protein